MKYDIFISYKRRGASSATAAYLYELLHQKGYSVFFDRKEMRSGKFNEQLLEHISNATDIIILLEEESLGSWFNHRTHKEAKSPASSRDNESSSNNELTSDFQENPYKTDWFCKEIMHALSLPGRNIVPILLNGYKMPEGKDLPAEMAELSLHNALSLDISEVDEFYEKYFVEQGYLKSKPVNLSMSKRFQSKGGIVGCFLFYTDVDSCDLFECGEKITTLTEDDDEWHPFRYPVNFAGEHRFRVINNDSCEISTIRCSVETNCQQYVQVQFNDTRNLWKLTKEEIDAQVDPVLLFRWGLGLFDGTTKHEPDIAISFECFSKAIELGSQESLSFIDSHGSGLIAEKQAPIEVAIKWYRIAAEHGNRDAQCNMGHAYRGGEGVEQDYKKAIFWYTQAAEQGDIVSQNYLGSMYYNGLGTDKDYKKAFEWYSRSAEQGDENGQGNLGNLYQNGFGVEKDLGKAIEWYTKAAEQGDSYSQDRLGSLYLDGNGFEKDYKKAFKWYTKAAEQGDASAQGNLGNMYHNGLGVERDYQKAIEWYTKSAEQGDPYSQDRLGDMYYEGQGVDTDYKKAFEWYTKAAKKGYVYSQLSLGDLYYNGLGTESDYSKAFRWFMKSAEQGDLYSQFRVGTMYFLGQGVVKDYERAIEWLSKAAEHGYKRAFNELAWAYHLVGDYNKALPWAEKAVDAFPDNPNVIDTMATVYGGLGQREDALMQFDKCLHIFREMNNEEGIGETLEKIRALKGQVKAD